MGAEEEPPAAPGAESVGGDAPVSSAADGEILYRAAGLGAKSAGSSESAAAQGRTPSAVPRADLGGDHDSVEGAVVTSFPTALFLLRKIALLTSCRFEVTSASSSLPPSSSSSPSSGDG